MVKKNSFTRRLASPYPEQAIFTQEVYLSVLRCQMETGKKMDQTLPGHRLGT